MRNYLVQGYGVPTKCSKCIGLTCIQKKGAYWTTTEKVLQ